LNFPPDGYVTPHMQQSTPNPPTSAAATHRLIRDIPIHAGYDVVVAGGGPAGAAAAISAARLGAKVLLIEGTGCLGGMGTSGLVTAIGPMANGKQGLVGGVMLELMEEMYTCGFIGPKETPDGWRKNYLHWTKFQPEGYKLVLDEKAKAASVEVRFFTRLIDAEFDAGQRRVKGVIIQNIEGYHYITAKTFIDCTGDAVLADLCGCDCWVSGRDTPHIMPASLSIYCTGIDWPRVDAYRKQHGTEQDTEIVRKGIADGMFIQPDPFLVGLTQVSATVGYLNAGHLFNLNALRCEDLSRNVMLGRRIAQDYLAFYRKYIPGCENMEMVATAALLGIRDSRRVKGEYQIKLADYLARREFPDQIGVFNRFCDVHPYNSSEEEYQRMRQRHGKTERLQPGEYFGIPYGTTVPKGWANLWVAGRCISCDVSVHGSIRSQPACALTGQAAGTAAVQSMRTGQPGNELDTEALVKTLRDANAFLPQGSTTKQMTRAA